MNRVGAVVRVVVMSFAFGAATGAGHVRPIALENRYRLATDLRIDIANTDFDQAVVLVVSGSGRFVVLDLNYRLHFFDASGVQGKVGGGKGAGPGEFDNPNRSGISGPEWWFYDGNLMRLSWFDSSGHYLRTLAVPQ